MSIQQLTQNEGRDDVLFFCHRLRVVRRNSLQSNRPHEVCNLPCCGVWVAWQEGAFLSMKDESGFQDLMRVLSDLLLFQGKQIHFYAIHQGNGSHAARRFRFRNNCSAHLGIGRIAGNVQSVFVKVEVLPLKPQTFTTANPSCCHQKHHASVFQCAF